jgi:hypothetical protein
MTTKENQVNTIHENVARTLYEIYGFGVYGRDLGEWDGPDLGSFDRSSENRHRVEAEKPRWRNHARDVLAAVWASTPITPVPQEAELLLFRLNELVGRLPAEDAAIVRQAAKGLPGGDEL